MKNVKVKITYSTDIEDVPAEVSKNLLSAFERSCSVSHIIDKTSSLLARSCIENGEISEHVAILKTIIPLLEKISDRVSDSIMILEGYENLSKNSVVSNSTEEEKETLTDS